MVGSQRGESCACQAAALVSRVGVELSTANTNSKRSGAPTGAQAQDNDILSPGPAGTPARSRHPVLGVGLGDLDVVHVHDVLALVYVGHIVVLVHVRRSEWPARE
jgi:hypothetical protein